MALRSHGRHSAFRFQLPKVAAKPILDFCLQLPVVDISGNPISAFSFPLSAFQSAF
jgi:hypothetical protein